MVTKIQDKLTNEEQQFRNYIESMFEAMSDYITCGEYDE